MRFCTQCGAEVRPGNGFCSSCGHKMGPASNEAVVEALTLQTADMGPAVSSSDEALAIPVGDTAPESVVEAERPSSLQVEDDLMEDEAIEQAAIKNTRPMGVAVEQHAAKAGSQADAPSNSSKALIVVLSVVAAVMVVAGIVVWALLFSGSGSQDGIAGSDSESSIIQADSADSASSTALSASSSSSVSSSSSGNPNNASGDYVLADSANRYYTQDELSSLSDWELYIARNEIFARHGRGFNNADLARYFGQKTWYHQSKTPAEFDADLSVLNDYERQNAETIKAVERSRNSPYLK